MTEENLVIHKIFSHTASQSPDRVALQIKKEDQWLEVSYGELHAHSLKVATFLVGEGFKKGEAAALILENRPEWAIIYLGIMYAGMTCVPLDPQLSPLELKNLILDSQAKIIFSSHIVFNEKIKSPLEGYPLRSVILEDARFPEIENITADASLMPEVSPDDTASLIYTSGTTAIPKGVLLSHRNICANFTSLQKLNLCFAGDNFLSILPLYHTYAFMGTLILPLFLGAKVTYCASLNPEEITQTIKEAQVSILVGVPQLFSLFDKTIRSQIKKIPFFLRPLLMPMIKVKVRQHLGRLRLMVSGGARLSPKITKNLSRLGYPLVEGYGLTETSPVVTINSPKNLKFGSVGLVLPDVQIKIGHPDKTGVGEVLIKGPNVMQGYFKHPDLTAEAIKDGWFYSGDIGYLDKDGYLFLTGREKEVIVLSSGKNIYPEELEEYYGRSPYIKEICILSRQEERMADTVESLYAVIVPDLEYFQKMQAANIYEKIRWELENLSHDLPAYKHIMGFTITKEELPRTALKKIKRYQVKEKYLKAGLPKAQIKDTILSEEDREILGQEMAQKIIHYLRRQLNKPVYLDSHLEIDLGVDSLTRVELGLGLEAMLGVEIPEELLYRLSTVREVIQNIQDLILESSGRVAKTEEAQKSWSQILSQPPSGERIIQSIRIEAGFLDKLLTFLFKNMFLFILRIFWHLKIKGRRFLPKRGPYLLCPNHASYLDAFVVFSGLTLRSAMNVFFLGYSRIFEHPLVAWAIKTARLIPVDPNINLTEAMQSISFVLKNEKVVCVFPEGRRSIDQNIGEFKKGVGILIKELNIPVVPVYIEGSHHAWPRTNLLPRPYPLKVIFGKPLTLKELTPRRQEEDELDDYEIIARRLKEEVLKLSC